MSRLSAQTNRYWHRLYHNISKLHCADIGATKVRIYFYFSMNMDKFQRDLTSEKLIDLGPTRVGNYRSEMSLAISAKPTVLKKKRKTSLEIVPKFKLR
ncbi:hypothetical protein J6590_078495 [Homalodisca vitripennis]|nr:hypothetical protein J6590_078495 [Homalodisca vitripennis]